MYTQFVRQLLLIMHLSGLALMVGLTIAAFVTFRAFKKRFAIKSESATGLLQLLLNLDPIKGVGGILLIISGIGLIYITGGGIPAHAMASAKTVPYSATAA